MGFRKSVYARHRQRLMAAAGTNIIEWERLEKELGRAMTLEELKQKVGYVNSKGHWVGPHRKIPCNLRSKTT